MRAITQYLKQQGYSVPDDSFYAQIDRWFKWYRGKVPSFHTYRQYNGIRKLTRERKTLGMAKKIPEDWASLELNEKVEIVIGNNRINKAVHEVLDANQFRVRGNQLLELAYALGTGAFVEYKDNDAVKIDYIRAGMVYPLRWDNGVVIDCAFASERTAGKEKQVYLNIHRMEGGTYVIENQMFRRNGQVLTPIDLPDGVQPIVRTGSDIPLFQIIKPNLVNSIDPDCPMGLSVFANAIDQLEGADLVYDSYINEFRLGKKRITIPLTMAQMQQTEDGVIAPVFDDNDTEFFAVPASREGKETIEEINMELRHEAHEAAIKTALGLLSAKCGLGNDRYNFDHGNIKTATEVVSEKSELYQNLKKHELVLEKALADMTRAIASLRGMKTDFEVSVNFDDSIIEDTAALKQQFLQEIRDGVRQKWEYRAKFFGEDEKAAKSMIEQAPDDEETMFGGGD